MKSDMVGKKYGRWTVLEYAGQSKGKSDLFKCRCDCGTIKDVLGRSLKSGNSKSCGCLKKDLLKSKTAEKHHNFRDITGQRFGRLVAIKPSEIRKPNYPVIWECKCDCGNVSYVPLTSLTSGKTMSCGCYFAEKNKEKGKNLKDLTGKRFGRLTVIERDNKDAKDGCAKWICSCDCGKETSVSSHLLISGATQSCGCKRDENRIKALKTKEFREKIAKITKDKWPDSAKAIGMQDNTNISILKCKKAMPSNPTGIRGVTRVLTKKKEVKYVATLTFQKKRHQKGGFRTVEEAKKERERMYEEIVIPYLESVGRA